MLGNTESFIVAIEQIREEIRIAEQRHQRLKEEFEDFRLKSILNENARHNLRLAIAAQGGE